MSSLTLKKAGFIGLGLIGGSIAKAIRQYCPDCEIVAFDISQESLADALKEGTLNISCDTVGEAFEGCDYIFLCTPVSYNNEYLKQITPYLSEHCTLTDVGSVKTSIHEAVSQMGLDSFFIGGHPMAGSEKSGYTNSKAHLIENAYYILTPSAAVPQDKVDAYRELAAALKALPIVLDYHLHDQITGTISHLPHLIASSLVNFVHDTDTPDGLMRQLAAGGFKDITRIASSSPDMWQQICLTNQENISALLTQYIDALAGVRSLVETADSEGLYHFFDSSREYRSSIPEASLGPIKKAYAIYCDIIDEAGTIAAISAILAANRISIKNIGIIHNREFEEGVLRIEFYDEAAASAALLLLGRYHYDVSET